MGRVRWWFAAGASRAELEALLPRVLAALDEGQLENQKTGRRKQLYPLRLAGAEPGQGPPDHLLKVNTYPAWAGLRKRFTGSKSRRELALADAVRARGVPTGPPVAAGEERELGRLRRCFLLVPLLPDVLDLRQLWFDERPDARERHALVRAFGRFSRRVHDADVFQDDFAPNNFLVRRGTEPELFMIDFERATLRRTSPADRLFMLAKIDRELAGATLTDRLRFLHGYADDPASARDWWTRIEARSAALAQRDLGRMRRNATRDGRRFVCLEDGEWTGFARRGLAVSEVRAARDGDFERAWQLEEKGPVWRVAYAGVSKSRARDVWATALLLAARGGLGPRPLALWQRQDRAVLVLERPSGALPLPADPAGGRALRVLSDRLLALGKLAEEACPAGFAAVPSKDGALRALLLAPHWVSLPGRGDPDRRSRSAALARRGVG